MKVRELIVRMLADFSLDDEVMIEVGQTGDGARGIYAHVADVMCISGSKTVIVPSARIEPLPVPPLARCGDPGVHDGHDWVLKRPPEYTPEPYRCVGRREDERHCGIEGEHPSHFW